MTIASFHFTTVVVTGNTAAESEAAVTKALKANPHIRYVLCTGQVDTEGTGKAIEQHFADQAIFVAGFDLSPETLRLIKAGHIKFVIDQQPYIQGLFPVIQLTLLKRYGIMPSDIDAGATLISADQVDQVMALTQQRYR